MFVQCRRWSRIRNIIYREVLRSTKVTSLGKRWKIYYHTIVPISNDLSERLFSRLPTQEEYLANTNITREIVAENDATW